MQSYKGESYDVKIGGEVWSVVVDATMNLFIDLDSLLVIY